MTSQRIRLLVLWQAGTFVEQEIGAGDRRQGNCQLTDITDTFRGQGTIVLAVDDDETVRALVRAILERAGLSYLEAPNVEEARRILRSAEVGLVVSDIDMPIVDDLEFVQSIKQTRPDLPVILMTGDGDRYTRQMADEAGADDYLLKPFRSADLLGKVGALVSLPIARLADC